MTIVGTDDREWLRTEADGDTILALGGNDYLQNRHSGTTLVGGDGNDQYRLYDPDAEIVEEADGGHDTIWAWRSMTIPDNVEDLVFKAVSNWHAIRGNDLGNKIVAGKGTQSFSGGLGDDTITGGADADTFSIEAGHGHDVITDFEVGVDLLTIWMPEFASFSDILAASEDTDAGLVITLGEDQSVTLEGVQKGEISAEDFGLQELPLPEGYTMVLSFEDGFDDAGSLTSGAWNTLAQIGHPVTTVISRGNREHTYIDQAIYDEEGNMLVENPLSVKDGILTITAARTPEAAADQVATEWVSGKLDTYDTFKQTYGYFEVRAKVPEGQGFWPAFWLTNNDHSWPPEIDILEMMGEKTDVYRTAVHSAIWGTKVTASGNSLIPDASADFHVYGMLWTPQEITFTFDGHVMFSIPTPTNMHDEMAITLNLAVGGWTGGSTEETPDSGEFQIDYVRAYEIPGIEELPRNEDMSAFGDLESGVLNTSSSNQTALYDDVIYTATEDTPDLIVSEGETATLVGDAGNNLLTGNENGTTFNGWDGDDTIIASAGQDYLIGGDGNDVLDGGVGNDTQVGGTGDDTYIIRRGDGASAPARDLIIEAPDEGFDTIYFADLLPEDIRSYIDWARWHIVVQGEDGPEYFAVKMVQGLGGSDLGSYVERAVFADGTVWDLTAGLYLSADDENNVSSGSIHDDTLRGNGGDDTLVGMDGDDNMDGGEGTDILYGWNGNDYMFDSGSGDSDSLYGEAGNDTLVAGAGIDLLDGGEGDDSLVASHDGDILVGGAGNDTLRGQSAADTLDGGDGDDSLFAGGGDDLLDGGAGDDRLLGEAGNDTLRGGAGSDRLLGGPGEDVLFGDAGDDILEGEAGNDWLQGGAGDDKLYGGKGDDTLDGGPGRDRYEGGEGADLFVFRLHEIDRDTIVDFGAEDRLILQVEGELRDIAISDFKNKIFIEDSATGEIFTLIGNAATASDVELQFI
ncbi:family 16 glycosylhydrolase [Salipiger mangrovisoli]|uniref:Family 16 glycosylhydrolase n=1 Tax=Salipiger mangrovisoli TaxID=2865933 RepID=A0ABR9X0K2_9RHOB|nr:family 16 glycosylhydrolase [Salipiger mangrovisoli]MBE9637073.1 family 16 glycosylhydrolase [Salipiger mangrovisoli]